MGIFGRKKQPVQQQPVVSYSPGREQSDVGRGVLSAGLQRSAGAQRPPAANVIDPWGRPSLWSELKGWHNYRPAVRSTCTTRIRGYDNREEWAVELCPEPTNRYDPNAVAVYGSGGLIGYLAKELAAEYAPALQAAAAHGVHYRVSASAVLWESGRNEFEGNITLHLPAANQLEPINGRPNPQTHVLIPEGGKINVLKENEHMDVITPLLVSGIAAPYVVTLRSIHEIRPRSSYATAEVSINGKPVGVLSKAIAEQVLPTVQYIERRGKTPAVKGSLAGSPLAAELTLYMQRAHEVSHEWLAALGPETPQTAPPTEPARPEPEWGDEAMTPQSTEER